MAYSHPNGPVGAALDELRAQRKVLDTAISALEKVLAAQASPNSVVTQPAQNLTIIKPRPVYVNTGAKPYAGMKIPEAAKALLAAEGRGLTNREIAEGLERGGFTHESDDFVNTVGSILKRHEQNNNGSDLMRAEQRWYLPEFLPPSAV